MSKTWFPLVAVFLGKGAFSTPNYQIFTKAAFHGTLYIKSFKICNLPKIRGFRVSEAPKMAEKEGDIYVKCESACIAWACKITLIYNE